MEVGGGGHAGEVAVVDAEVQRAAFQAQDCGTGGAVGDGRGSLGETGQGGGQRDGGRLGNDLPANLAAGESGGVDIHVNPAVGEVANLIRGERDSAGQGAVGAEGAAVEGGQINQHAGRLTGRRRAVEVGGGRRAGQAAIGDVEGELIADERQFTQAEGGSGSGSGAFVGTVQRSLEKDRSDLAANFSAGPGRRVNVDVDLAGKEHRLMGIAQDDLAGERAIAAEGTAVERSQVDEHGGVVGRGGRAVEVRR